MWLMFKSFILLIYNSSAEEIDLINLFKKKLLSNPESKLTIKWEYFKLPWNPAAQNIKNQDQVLNGKV